MSQRRSVTIVSPHYDDVPLSLGQSLRDGALSRCSVRVRVAFGNSNWTTWVHPTRSRAVPITWLRRAEETVAARSFGYRWTAAGWDEALLRWGVPGSDELLDAQADLTDEPLIDEVGAWLVDVARSADGPELVLVPAGLGGHVDHRIVALAAAGRRHEMAAPVGFYEDRPYVAHLEPEQIRTQLSQLGPALEAIEVSGPITETTQRRVRRAYPSQMDEFFISAMRRDLAAGAVERVWFARGEVPDWLR